MKLSIIYTDFKKECFQNIEGIKLYLHFGIGEPQIIIDFFDGEKLIRYISKISNIETFPNKINKSWIRTKKEMRIRKKFQKSNKPNLCWTNRIETGR